MGPLYRTTWIQDTIQQNSSFVFCSDQNESILLPVSQRRDRKPSQQTGSGKGTESRNSWLLFPDLPSSKKERKVTFDYRPFFIEPIHKETVFQNGDSQVGKTSDETQRLGCLHRLNRCIPTCSDTSSIPEVSSFRLRRSGLSLHGLTVRNVAKSVDIFETDGCYSSVSMPTCHINLPVPRRLANRKSDSQPLDYSDKILHSNYSKSKFSAKSQEIRSRSFSEIHLYRHGISDTSEFSQGSNGLCSEPISDNQEISVIQTCIGTNFPFPFGQTQCCSRLRYPRQTALTSPSDVSFVCLETSYSSSRSSYYDKQYDSISLTMVEKPQSVQNRDYYPSSRSQILPLYGCQSFRMGSSFRADNTILSWSLDRRPIPAPYQYVRNDGHTISTETSHNIYSPFLHHDIYRQHNGGLIYQQTGWHSFSQPLRRSLGNSQLVPGTRHHYQSSSHSRQIQHSCRPPIKIRQTYQDRMGSDQTVANSVFQMLNFPNVDLFAIQFNHKLPLYVSPVQDNKALAIDALSMDWNHLHAYAFPPFILIPAVLEKIRQHQCRIVRIAPFWPQQQWFSELLLLLVSAPIRLPLIPSLLTQSKGRFVHQNLPLLDLHAWELSNNQSEIKNFRKMLKNIYTKSLRCKMDHLL